MALVRTKILFKSLLFLHIALGRPTPAMDIRDGGEPSSARSAPLSFPVFEAEADNPNPGPPLDSLFERIRRAVGADYNWPGRVKKGLETLACSSPDPALKSKIDRLLKRLKQPEDLLFFAPHEDKTILYRPGLTAESGVFQTFKLLFEELDALSIQLDRAGGIAPDQANAIRRDLEQLRHFYERFITGLCTGDHDQKDLLLEQKALLYLENPLDSYRVSQGTARELISKDRYGFVDKKNAAGMHAVQSRDGVHFKLLEALDDPRPGMEYMAYVFAQALSKQFLVTPSVLLKLEGVSLFDTTENFPSQLSKAKYEGKSLNEALAELHISHKGGWQECVKLGQHNFFLQASRTIGDRDFFKVLKEKPQFLGDPVNLGWQFLFALLTNPGDGKADNYSVDEHGAVIGGAVIGIDNDKLFHPALFQNSEDLCIGINCIFYLLDPLMDAPLHPGVQEAFLSLNPSLVVLRWLISLHEKNMQCQDLARQGILTPHDLQTLGLPIRLSLNLPSQILNQITSLQRCLKGDASLTPQQLFRELYPYPANYYQALRERHRGDPLMAMAVIYKGHDEEGAPQRVNHVLGLPPQDPTWRGAQRNGLNPLEDDLALCSKHFIQTTSKEAESLAANVAMQIQNDPYQLLLPGKEIDDVKVHQVILMLYSLPSAPISALKVLDLQDNKLTLEGLKGLQKLTSLETLNLNNNLQLTKESTRQGASTVPDLTANLIASSFPNLTALSINRVAFGTDGIILLAKGLRNLKTFHAMATHRGDGAIEAITTFLPALTNLNFSRNALTSEGTEQLLTKLPNLQCLAIGDRGTLPAIMANLPQALQGLTLDHMRLNAPEQINPLPQRVSNLLSLNLQYNAFGPDSGKGLGQTISRLRSLQTLTLTNNNLQGEGIRDLTAPLARHPSLTSLSVDKNGLGLEGIKALFASLQSLNALRFLNIQHNGISDEQRASYRRLCENFQRQKPFVRLIWED